MFVCADGEVYDGLGRPQDVVGYYTKDGVLYCTDCWQPKKYGPKPRRRADVVILRDSEMRQHCADCGCSLQDPEVTPRVFR